MGHCGHTYLPMSDVFYTMPITLVRFLLRYLPTPKSDVLYERSPSLLEQKLFVHFLGELKKPKCPFEIN